MMKPLVTNKLNIREVVGPYPRRFGTTLGSEPFTILGVERP